MFTYEVDYSYYIEEFAMQVINADDPDQAEEFALEYIKDTYPEATNIKIEMVKKINV